MLKNFRTTCMFFIAVACAAPVLAADATMDQVYQALRAGEVTQAEQMMTEVLRDHPQSAKAHYVAAEVYARAGDAATARAELGTAQRLAPGLPFAPPQSLQALQRELARGEPRRMSSGYMNARPPFSMGTVLLVLGGIVVLWLIFRRRTTAANVYPQYAGAVPAGVGGVGPGYGAPGVGSGIAGGLASGLAVGAGVVAGEELARHFLDRPGGALPGAVEPGPDNGDLGGNDFGVSDTRSWDDSSAGGDGGDAGGGGDWS